MKRSVCWTKLTTKNTYSWRICLNGNLNRQRELAGDERRNEFLLFRMDGGVEISRPVEREGLYHFFFSNCPGGKVSFKVCGWWNYVSRRLMYSHSSTLCCAMTMVAHVTVLAWESGRSLPSFSSSLWRTLLALLLGYCTWERRGTYWESKCGSWLTRRRTEVYKIHYLMLVVVVLKGLALLIKAVMRYYIKCPVARVIN